MKTVIEIWHTDSAGWESNYLATRSVIRGTDEAGPYEFEWVLSVDNTRIHSTEDITALRKLLDEIEKDFNENDPQ